MSREEYIFIFYLIYDLCVVVQRKEPSGWVDGSHSVKAVQPIVHEGKATFIFKLLSELILPMQLTFLQSKLDDFLETFPAQYLSSDSVSSEEFERRVQILTSLLTEPPQSYGQEAQAIWANIRDDLPQDYRQQVHIAKSSKMQSRGK